MIVITTINKPPCFGGKQSNKIYFYEDKNANNISAKILDDGEFVLMINVHQTGRLNDTTRILSQYTKDV